MSIAATGQRVWRCVSRLTRAAAALAVLSGLATAAAPARAAVADDPTGAGPYTAKFEEYKLGPVVDPLVSKGSRDKNNNLVQTELWARVWYPTKGPGLKPKSAPIVVFLHGNHPTCGRVDGKWRIDDKFDYSFFGACPTGYKPTPNHWGYDYIASRLATQGYVSISINTNRGINIVEPDPNGVDPDPFLIVRRGRMILRHLMQFGRWDSKVDPAPKWFDDIRGNMDWTKLSLVGHSRGGDAIVNAYYQFRGDTDSWKSRLPSNMSIVALAAIAPTDFAVQQGAAGDPLPLKGVGYGVLLPMCDGDVFRLSGVKFYDRAVGYFPDLKGNFKAVFAVNGADHNGFNTEWHPHDQFDVNTGKFGKQDCPGQKKLFPQLGVSEEQQEIGRYFVMSVIRAKTKDGSWAETLNPAFDLPKPIAKFAIDRSWFPGTPLNGAILLKRFSRQSATLDCGSETIFGYQGVTASCLNVPEHNFNVSNLPDKTNAWAARVQWGKPANSDKPENKAYWAFVNLRSPDSDFKPINLGRSSKMKTLDIRVGPDCTTNKDTSACTDVSKQAPDEKGAQNIEVQFVDDKQHYSNRHLVPVKKYADERQAVGLKVDGGGVYHAILSSARIPLTEFEKDADGAFNMSKVVAILIKFSPEGVSGDNKAGGLFIGDIWATTEAVTSMNFAERAQDEMTIAGGRDIPPAPPTDDEARAQEIERRAAAPLTATAVASSSAPELASVSADPGSRIVDAVRTAAPAAALPPSLGAAAGADAAVVELTLASRTPVVDAAGAFSVSIGGHVVDAVVRTRANRQSTLVIPASVVDAAPDGAAIVVISGGATRRFGALNKASIR